MAALEQIRQNTAQAVGSTTYVSWAVANKGDVAVNELFFVDLLFDGVAVARWSGIRLDTVSLSVITDWDSLEDVVRLTPGDHTLKLIVDPTNLIHETDETDNEIEFPILHRRIQDFLHRLTKTVNLVDEEHVAFAHTVQSGRQICRSIQRGTACNANVGVHFAGDDVGERCFSESRRPAYQNMVDGFAAFFGGE